MLDHQPSCLHRLTRAISTLVEPDPANAGHVAEAIHALILATIASAPDGEGDVVRVRSDPVTLPKRLRELAELRAVRWHARMVNLDTQAEDLPEWEAAHEIERLRADLRKYGNHTGLCDWGIGHDCDCGWHEHEQSKGPR
jgi:hypothetical protein